MAVWRARQLDVRNFSVLVFHVTVPPAMRTVLEAPGNRVQAFLAAGHACSVMGWMDYEPIAVRYRVPIVVTGVEPVDVLEGIYMAVRQLEEGRYEVENQYVQSGRREGLVPARDLVAKVFQVVDRQWRGIGLIPGSGLALRAEYADYDTEIRFGLTVTPTGGSHAPADR
jgi:hydrogenase expression/formation protein HypD